MAPPFSCSACQVDLREYSSRGENTCTKCKKVFCSSCYGLKLKLENSMTRSSRRSCTSCQQLISIKKTPLLTSPMNNNTEAINECKDNTDIHHNSIVDRSFDNTAEDIHHPEKQFPVYNQQRYYQSKECNRSQGSNGSTGKSMGEESYYDQDYQSSLGENSSWNQNTLSRYPGHDNPGYPYDVAEDENLEELEDIPAFDDIPYALILCGAYDKTTLEKAKKKQSQINLMNQIQYQTEHGGEMPPRQNNNPAGAHVKQGSYERQLRLSGSEPNAEEKHSTRRPGGSRQTETQTGYSRSADWPTSDTNPINEHDRRPSVLQSSSKQVHGSSNDNLENNEPLCRERSSSPTTSIQENDFENIKPETYANSGSRGKKNPLSSAKTSFHAKPASVMESGSTFNRREETEQEKKIRDKRLERFKPQQRSYNTTNGEPGQTKSAHKPDNRDIAPNAKDIHKPVKSIAFKHTVTVSSLQSTTNPKPPQHKNDICFKNDNSKQDSDSDSDQRPTAMSFFQHRQGGQSDRGLLVGTPVKPARKMSQGAKAKGVEGSVCPKQNTESVDKRDKRSSSPMTRQHVRDNDLRPSLRGEKPPWTNTAHTQSNLRPESLSSQESKQPVVPKHKQDDRTEHDASESDDDNAIPDAIRFVRNRKESGYKRQTTGRQVYQLVPEGLGPEERQGPISLKKPKRNKNEGLNDTPSAITTVDKKDSVAFHDKTEQESRPTIVVFLGPSSETEISKSGTSFMVRFSTVANQHHRAFKRLRHTQNEDGLKCTNCGRPDCQGFTIIKMKELITSAKANGFEVRDVTPDGNCMFAAVVDQLQMYGDYRFGPKSLREAAVSWLIEHPFCEDGLTHYEQFLSETWETYLQRMMAEGEWGDHVILRAIVNVIGHIVRVLNVSGEDIRWTELEPLEENNENRDIHLILGHVGEFHYTSLRPTDSEPKFVPSTDTEVPPNSSVDYITQQSIEGTELIEMFHEDYVDPWSETPVIHFSFLLKQIVPQTTVLNGAAILSSQLIDQQTEKKMDMLVMGSAGEGTFYPALIFEKDESGNMSKWINLEMFITVMKYHVRTKAVHDQDSNSCEIDETGCHPGYLKLVGKRSYGADAALVNLESATYKSSEDSQEKSVVCVPIDGISLCIPTSRRLVLKCNEWPEVAKQWQARERCEGWPSSDIISSIVAEGCFILAEPHKDSQTPNIEWQYSFASAEKALFHDAVTPDQKYCYMLLLCLCYQTLKNETVFKINILKNVFFLACERVPSEHWRSSPGSCILYMLDQLLCSFREGCLPNYFIISNNMIDHMSSSQRKQIENQLVQLRAQPNLYLRQINESLGLFQNGGKVIDDVWDDSQLFREHRSVKMSTLNVFVPSLIAIAKEYIRKIKYKEGLETLNEAFQERLAVSTCDDTMTYQMFLQGSVSGLSTMETVWFSNYADKQLGNQLSKTMIRETCSDLGLVRIDQIIPKDTAGIYGDAEVPSFFGTHMDAFCHDFASFLVLGGKFTDALPVLYYCHDQYKEYKRNVPATIETIGKFSDAGMLNVYFGLYKIYIRQKQLEFFRNMLPEMDEIGERINTQGVYYCLANIHSELKDESNYQRYVSRFQQLNPNDQETVSRCYYWPRSYLLC